MAARNWLVCKELTPSKSLAKSLRGCNSINLPRVILAQFLIKVTSIRFVYALILDTWQDLIIQDTLPLIGSISPDYPFIAPM